jgi:hypothetical protein
MLDAVSEFEQLDVLERVGSVGRAGTQIRDRRDTVDNGDLVVRLVAAENCRIDAAATVDRIVTRAAGQDVITGAAGDDVIE